MRTRLYQDHTGRPDASLLLARSEGMGGLANQFPRYSGAPSQSCPIIIRDVIRDLEPFGPVFVSARWGSDLPVGQRCQGRFATADQCSMRNHLDERLVQGGLPPRR